MGVVTEEKRYLYGHLVPEHAVRRFLEHEISTCECADLIIDCHLAAGKPYPRYSEVLSFLDSLERDFLTMMILKGSS